jgi:uncharacterized Zn finger protein
MSKKKYLPRIPILAHGFRAQSLRNPPRDAWWMKHWLQAIDEMRLGARAGRGKLYAERGQVTEIEVSGTQVHAKVLGARKDAYTVKIAFRPGGAISENAAAALGAMTVGRIYAGEMPLSVEELFSKNGDALYPTLGADSFWCSCPDWSKPCKHIAAVLYLLGDVLARDPSLLLRLRGMDGGCPSHLPLWKGEQRLDEAIERIMRRVNR